MVYVTNLFTLEEFAGYETNSLSPRKQLAVGLMPNEIMCKPELELIFKALDNSPACVKSETVQKLVFRGWTMLGSP